MSKSHGTSSPGYTIFGVVIIVFIVFFIFGGRIPFLQKSEAAVKHVRYEIKGINGMPEELQKQYIEGKEILYHGDKMYVVIKTDGADFSHITQVKKEGNKIVLYKQTYREKISVYTTPTFLVELEKTDLPIVVREEVINNTYLGRPLGTGN